MMADGLMDNAFAFLNDDRTTLEKMVGATAFITTVGGAVTCSLPLTGIGCLSALATYAIHYYGKYEIEQARHNLVKYLMVVTPIVACTAYTGVKLVNHFTTQSESLSPA